MDDIIPVVASLIIISMAVDCMGLGLFLELAGATLGAWWWVGRCLV